jgi:flagellar biosynthesis/type III secretory pathway protein FliH
LVFIVSSSSGGANVADQNKINALKQQIEKVQAELQKEEAETARQEKLPGFAEAELEANHGWHDGLKEYDPDGKLKPLHIQLAELRKALSDAEESPVR